MNTAMIATGRGLRRELLLARRRRIRARRAIARLVVAVPTAGVMPHGT